MTESTLSKQATKPLITGQTLQPKNTLKDVLNFFIANFVTSTNTLNIFGCTETSRIALQNSNAVFANLEKSISSMFFLLDCVCQTTTRDQVLINEISTIINSNNEFKELITEIDQGVGQTSYDKFNKFCRISRDALKFIFEKQTCADSILLSSTQAKREVFKLDCKLNELNLNETSITDARTQGAQCFRALKKLEEDLTNYYSISKTYHNAYSIQYIVQNI